MSGHISYSQATTLATCEQKWYYKYVEQSPDPTGPGAAKGTMLHGFLRRWWTGETAKTGIVLDAPENETQVQAADDVFWLAQRYVEHYGVRPSDFEVISVEQEFDTTIGDQKVHGFIDRLARDSDRNLWVVEDKSYAKRDRLTLLNIDPQLSTYVVGAESILDEPVHGVLFNGIYTYRWVKDRPVAESFDRVYLDRSPHQRASIAHWYNSIEDRRQDILVGGRLPVANIGTMTCKMCTYRSQCWSDQLGDDLLVIEN